MKKRIIQGLVACSLLATWSFSTQNQDNRITYVKDIQPFMAANCYNCHSTGLNYYPYGGDLSHYDSLYKRVENGLFRQHVIVNKTMPPGGMWSVSPGLPEVTLKMLDSWISAGAPYE